MTRFVLMVVGFFLFTGVSSGQEKILVTVKLEKERIVFSSKKEAWFALSPPTGEAIQSKGTDFSVSRKKEKNIVLVPVEEKRNDDPAIFIVLPRSEAVDQRIVIHYNPLTIQISIELP